MRKLVVLGAGTAGTMVANRLRRRLDRGEWAVVVVDRDDEHTYQPGFLRLPFGGPSRSRIVRSRRAALTRGVEVVTGDVAEVLPDEHRVRLVDGRVLDYDQLVIATGVTPRPDQTPGMLGAGWRRSVFDFYTLDGAEALAGALRGFTGGRLVVHITEMPIKCPVAPLEFAFLADSWARRRGIRDRVEITYVTPLSGAFTRPTASRRLGRMLDRRNIRLEADFLVESVDTEARRLVSYDGREVPYDLLVTVPLNMGADFVAASSLGDELNQVRVDRHMLQARGQPDIFAIGDANDIPASKAGSVAHFSVDVFVENFLEHVAGRPMTHSFDGHANCFVEAGDGKALLIDFNYDVEPLPGKYPLPVVGPLDLLKESRLNHLGKLAFGWVYWHLLLPGRPLPLPSHLSMAGKRGPRQATPDDQKLEV
ncbi:MAG: type III sulfide quinone reductase, selenoprotein subtype [Nocardioidaceae bacterium]